MTNENDFFDGVIGGGELPEHKIRKDLVPPTGLVARSPLDKSIIRLLTLHPQLEIKFRNNSLSGLDNETKKALLKDMRDCLGIISLHDE